MQPILDKYKQEFERPLAMLGEELSTMRVGRANPMIVENILVEAYGAKTPLKQLASITAPEARTILIAPWDKAITKEVEKGIIEAKIGLNPVNEGSQIRLVVPQLTEESRRELVRSVGEKMEKIRITIRQVRDKVKTEVEKSQKAGELTEDDKYDLIKKLDDQVKTHNEKIKELGDKKEKEIMTI